MKLSSVGGLLLLIAATHHQHHAAMAVDLSVSEAITFTDPGCVDYTPDDGWTTIPSESIAGYVHYLIPLDFDVDDGEGRKHRFISTSDTGGFFLGEYYDKIPIAFDMFNKIVECGALFTTRIWAIGWQLYGKNTSNPVQIQRAQQSP